MNQRLMDELQIMAKQKVRSVVEKFIQNYIGGSDEVYNPGRNVPVNNSGATVRQPEMGVGNNGVEPGLGLDNRVGN